MGQTSAVFRFFLLMVLSIALMIVDYRSTLLHSVRIITPLINIPFETVIRLPGKIQLLLEKYYPDSALYDRFAELQKEQLILESRLQQYETLLKENERLSKLLSSASKKTVGDVLLANIVEVGFEPFDHKIVIDKGIESGVYPGQPAISLDGVLGQVSVVGYKRSKLVLITDPGHGLPVQIRRNTLRTIVKGSGHTDEVILPFLGKQADIEQGDILVTSGMGGRFPAGYKVAEVTEIIKDANEAFLSVTGVTSARISFTKEVLLLWDNDRSTVDSDELVGRLSE